MQVEFSQQRVPDAMPAGFSDGFPCEFQPRSLSLSQAGEALRVSRRTLYYWIKLGRLSTVRTPMGSQRVLFDSLTGRVLERT